MKNKKEATFKLPPFTVLWRKELASSLMSASVFHLFYLATLPFFYYRIAFVIPFEKAC